MSKRPFDTGTGGIQVDRAGDSRQSSSEKNKLYPVRSEPIDKHLDRLSFLLDRAIKIPGTNFRFGLDPLISFFFPVAGDAMGALMSAYIVLLSIRHGLPKGVIARMVFNVGADFLIGSIPLVGDVFDFAWKSNDKNMKLLNRHATGAKRSSWGDWAWLFILMGLLVVIMIGIFILAYYGLKALGLRLI